VGIAGRLRPHRSVATRRLSSHPTEREHPGVVIN